MSKQRVFKKQAKHGWFETEAEGLRLLAKYSEGLVKIPEIYSCKNHVGIEMELIDNFVAGEAGQASLKKLAQAVRVIHDNSALENHHFGFHLPGQCGELDHPNLIEENDSKSGLDWIEFFHNYRLGYQLQVLRQKYPEQQEMLQLGEQINCSLVEFFDGKGLPRTDIRSSSLHGDLWSGNWGTISTSEKVCLIDPAPFYGHFEFDFGIGTMFGSPSGPTFFKAYFNSEDEIPKGFYSRQKLYSLYHHLNHVNIFGPGSYGRRTRELLHDIVNSELPRRY